MGFSALHCTTLHCTSLHLCANDILAFHRLCELNHQWLEELQVKETSCLLLLELLADILYVCASRMVSESLHIATIQ